MVKITTLIVLHALVGATLAFTPSQPAFSRKLKTQCSATLEGRQIKGDFKPINNFLLVKVAPAQEETEGGILLSGKAKIKKTEGTVISVGPGKTHQDSGAVFEMPVEAGEGVVYGKFDGTEVKYNDEPHTLIRDDDILIKFTGDELTLESCDVIRDSCLVRPNLADEEESTGGILLAKSSTSEAKPSTGEVVKVGPGRMAANGSLMDMDVGVGDMIKFRDYAGNEVTVEGEEYTVVRMIDILAKF